jgi:HEAT repeat protein
MLSEGGGEALTGARAAQALPAARTPRSPSIDLHRSTPRKKDNGRSGFVYHREVPRVKTERAAQQPRQRAARLRARASGALRRGAAWAATAVLTSLSSSVYATNALQFVHDDQYRVELIEEFERVGLSRQIELGKRIIALRDPSMLKSLDRWLSDDDRHVRANVAFVFAGLGDERGFQVIGAILSDRSDRPEGQGIPGGRWSLEGQIQADRYYAVHVLSNLKDGRAVDLLVPLLTDKGVNYKVAWALGEIGDRRAAKPLIDALRIDDARVRVIAIQALEELGAAEALPYLQDLLGDARSAWVGEAVTVAEAAKAAIATLTKARQTGR